MSFCGIPIRFFGRIFFVFIVSVYLIVPALALGATSEIDQSLTFLQSYQDESGGLKDSNPFDPSNTSPQDLQTSWGIMAFGFSGYDSQTVKQTQTQKSLVDYLETKACNYTLSTDLERTILAAEATGLDATTFASCTPTITSKLEAMENGTTGEIGSGPISTIFGVLAYKSYGHAISSQTLSYLISQQKTDGGWEFGPGFGSDSNTTAQALMAFKAARVDLTQDPYATSIANAKTYLKSLQTTTGGIKYDANPWSTVPDANSDSNVAQAIYAIGEDPGDAFWLNGSQTIFDDLASLRQADGSYNFSSDVGQSLPVFTTAVVIPALTHQFLPVVGQNLTSFNQTTTPTPTNTTEPPAPTPDSVVITAPITTTSSTSDQPATSHSLTDNEPESSINTNTSSNSISSKKNPPQSIDQPSVATSTFTDQSNLTQPSQDQTTIEPTIDEPKAGDVLGAQTARAPQTQWDWLAVLAALGLISGTGFYIVQNKIKAR